MSYVDAGGVKTFYEVAGKGAPLLLLHGGMVTNETWAGMRGAMAEHFMVYMPERRGHGRTPDVPGPVSYVQMAADTAAFMQAMRIPTAHLVGWSDGGVVALELAMSAPELVRKMVLIGANFHYDAATEEGDEWLAKLTVETMPRFLREPYERLSPDGPAHFPVVAEKNMTMWRTQPTHEASDLRSVVAPTLVMVGDNDAMTLEHTIALHRAIAKSQLAVVPGASHGVMFDKPGIVNRLILDFLLA